MSRLLRRYLLAALALIAVGGATAWLLRPTPEPPRRVLVFGIDGGTWEILEPMIEAGELPTLARFYHQGTHGVLRSRRPAISPVAWSTIFTGKLPKAHGVRSWQTSQSSHRGVKAVWEITSDLGLPTHVFNVPATWPPEPVEGVMVSGFPVSGSHVGGTTGLVVGPSLQPIHEGDRLHAVHEQNADTLLPVLADLDPGEWSDWIEVAVEMRRATRRGVMKVRALPGGRFWLTPFYRTDPRLQMTTPRGLRRDVLTDLLGAEYIPEGPGWDRHDQPETPIYLFEHLTEIADQQTRVVEAWADAPWSLLIYVHTLVDRVSHPYWAYDHPDAYPELDPERAAAWQGTVAEAYRQTDRDLAELVASIDGEYHVVIVSDHGFRVPRDPSRHIGAHQLDGIYLVAGPGIPAGEGPRLQIEDVTPTILYLLGLPVADDFAGEAPARVVDALDRPVQTIPTWESDSRERSDLPVDAATWEQLRGLGYVEGPAPGGDADSEL